MFLIVSTIQIFFNKNITVSSVYVIIVNRIKLSIWKKTNFFLSLF